MIVTHNSQDRELTVGQQYDALFATAYQALEAVNKLRIEPYEDKKFHSIDEYFAHMADLYAIDPVYIMLPLNETAFIVDANKRTINNPKITVLQGDQNSEIVTFVIDRYFDYKDLATAQYTFVQWTLPDGTEGATNIELKDLNVPGNGKLRLGWPLDNEITSQKGSVKFSLRFFDTAPITENGVTKTVVVYSFNTLTSSLNINESLQPEVDPNGINVNDPVNEGLFRKSIINSQIHLNNMPIALTPRFEEPGLDLNQYESLAAVIGEDGEPTGATTLTMKAQAIVTDSGSLSYEWWYKPAEDIDNFNSNTWYPYDSKIIDDVTLPGFKALGGQVKDEYKAIIYDGKAQPGEKFYKDEQGTAAGLEDLIVGNTLYEKFTTYTVPSDEKVKVTGQYKVTASNTIGSNEAKKKDSRTCFLVSPADIAFERGGDLNNIEVFAKNADGEDLSKTLVVNPTSDSTIGAKREFVWTRYTTNPLDENNELKNDATPASTITKPSMDENKNEGRKHEVANPGWYQVTVQSTLNRQTKTLESTVCKVTSEPVAPKLVGVEGATVTMAYGPESSQRIDPIDNIATYNLNQGDTAVLDITVANVPQSDYDALLFSEGVTYEWGVQINDGKSQYRPLSDKDVGEGKIVKEGLGTNKLTIYRDIDGVQYTFKCIITNHLNKKTATCSAAEALAFYIR